VQPSTAGPSRPGSPTSSTRTHIQASVSFEQLTGADTDRRSGGSCLVADLNDKTPCETSADCAHLFLPTGGYHYCLGAAGDTDHKICWTRPSAAGCTRGSRADGDVATTTVAPVLVDGRPVKWIRRPRACPPQRWVPSLTVARAADPARSVYATSHKLEQ
jgi:hypothetical protein